MFSYRYGLVVYILHLKYTSNFAIHNPPNTKHVYNIFTTSAKRLRRWSNIVQMLYQCFVFAGNVMLLNVEDQNGCLTTNAGSCHGVGEICGFPI